MDSINMTTTPTPLSRLIPMSYTPDLSDWFVSSFTELARIAHANSRAKGFWTLMYAVS